MKNIPTTTSFLRIFLSLAIVLAATGAVATPVAAQNDQPDWAVAMFDDMGPMVEKYNANVDAGDFGVMASQLKNQNVNLVVYDRGNQTRAYVSRAYVSFRLDEDLRIQELKMGKGNDADIRMKTEKAAMDRIIASNTPASEFQNAFEQKDIKIKGITAWSRVKWTAINLVADVLRGIFG